MEEEQSTSRPSRSAMWRKGSEIHSLAECVQDRVDWHSGRPLSQSKRAAQPGKQSEGFRDRVQPQVPSGSPRHTTPP